ncbi:nucleotidyltransferase [Frankia sp. AgB32]|uniref:SMODS domain-containing nucleotidyltransferase n=1 Tax=Frankia sp. AgB32 TaxID=631119 RepID=UPI00200F6ADD|nr:nucleotidyltransferase [Frankia sp. AgB32]MCK9898341.1 nucleotidyltransferase [Frankia sp. AgB32]
MSVETPRGTPAGVRPGEVTYDHLIIPSHWRRSNESTPDAPNALFPADDPAGHQPSMSPINPATGAMTGPLLVGTTARAFAKLDDLIRLSVEDKAVIAARRDEADRALRAIFPPRCALPLVGVATIGSAGRDTMISPLDEVDIFAVFSAANSAWKRFRWDSRDLVLCVRNAIGGERIQTIGSRGQALRIVYDSPPDVHLVPAFDHPRAGYVMPDRVGGWLPTRPERHLSWMADLGPRVMSAVRLLKAWNRVCGSHLRSFHIEALAGQVLAGRGLNTRQGLAEVFRHMDEDGLAVADPADVRGDLSGYVRPEDLEVLGENIRLARLYSAKAVAAEQAGNHEEAVALWGSVFGPEFPTFG